MNFTVNGHEYRKGNSSPTALADVCEDHFSPTDFKEMEGFFLYARRVHR